MRSSQPMGPTPKNTRKNTLKNTKRIGKAAALGLFGALLLGSPTAQASHEQTGSLALAGLVLANITMLPSYYSVGYYAYAAPDTPMPKNWATMNCVTGALGASVGFYGMFKAGQTQDLDHGTQVNHSEVLLGLFGGLTVATSAALIASSIVMARRPSFGAPEDGGVKSQRRVMLMPTMGPGMGGFGLMGTF